MKRTFRTLTINDSFFVIDNTTRNPEVKEIEIGNMVHISDIDTADENGKCYVMYPRGHSIGIEVRKNDIDASIIIEKADKDKEGIAIKKGYFLDEAECRAAFREVCKDRISDIAEIMVWCFF
jgi:hypothetical protein